MSVDVGVRGVGFIDFMDLCMGFMDHGAHGQRRGGGEGVYAARCGAVCDGIAYISEQMLLLHFYTFRCDGME